MPAISQLVKPRHQEVISWLRGNGELKTALAKVEPVTPAKWRDIERKLGCGLQGPSRTGARSGEVLKLLWNFFKIPIWQGENLRSPTSAPDQGLPTSTRPWPVRNRAVDSSPTCAAPSAWMAEAHMPGPHTDGPIPWWWWWPARHPAGPPSRKAWGRLLQPVAPSVLRKESFTYKFPLADVI